MPTTSGLVPLALQWVASQIFAYSLGFLQDRRRGKSELCVSLPFIPPIKKGAEGAPHALGAPSAPLALLGAPLLPALHNIAIQSLERQLQSAALSQGTAAEEDCAAVPRLAAGFVVLEAGTCDKLRR